MDMLHFDKKWTLSATLCSLSHPERARTIAAHEANVAMESEAMKNTEEAKRKIYAEAYKKLIDGIARDCAAGREEEAESIVYSFQNHKPHRQF
jgi:hypothetical protein